MRFFMACLCCFGIGRVSPFKGSIKASVTLTRYDTVIVPCSLGVPTSGYANGKVGCCHGKVVSAVEERVQ